MAAPVQRVIGTAASGLGTITPAPNAGHVSGDVELLFVETANEAATLSTAAGFAAVTGTGVGTGTAAGTTGTRMSVFWRRWNGSDGSPTVADSGNHQFAVIISYSGVIATGNPWDVVGSNQQAAATTAGSASGVTTTVNDTLVVIAEAGAQPDAAGTTEVSGWTNANLATLTERYDETVTTGNGAAMGIADGTLAIAGATGATTYTTVTSTTKDNVVIALLPVSGNQIATPGTLALTLSTFSPTVTASNHQTVTPGVLALVTTTFAPSVVVNTIATPAVLALTTTTFAPTVSVSDNKTATPGVTALTLSPFAPTVSVSNNQVSTPGVLTLVTSTFAPTITVSDHKTVTPGVLGLTLSTFAPAVTASDHKTVTPDVVSLTLTSFAPTVTAGSAGNVTVTPGVLALTLVTFAPTVTATETPPRSVEGDRGLPTTAGRAPRRHVPFEMPTQFQSEWAQDDEDVLFLLLVG